LHRAFAQKRNPANRGAPFAGNTGMPTNQPSSALPTEYEQSWTAGMPVHPEPSAPARRAGLSWRQICDLTILSGISVLCVALVAAPLAGVEPRGKASPPIVARELRFEGALLPALVPNAARQRGGTFELRPAAARSSPGRITRLLMGDGRYRARPFPRPAEFD
jgi:hypothetical protein